MSVFAGVRAALPVLDGVLDGEPADSECPPGMVYKSCGTACPKSCASRASGDPMRMCIQVSARESAGGRGGVRRGGREGEHKGAAARAGDRSSERASERKRERQAWLARSGRASEERETDPKHVLLSQVCNSGCFCTGDKPWVSKDGSSCYASFDDCPGESEGSVEPEGSGELAVGTDNDAFDLVGEPDIFPRRPGDL